MTGERVPKSERATAELRQLPSVDRLAGGAELRQAMGESGRALTVTAIRLALEQARERIHEGAECPPESVLIAAALSHLDRLSRPTLRPIINASGVIVHTNLGRAPLSEATRAAMSKAGAGYSNLEYDIDEGHRGSRYHHAEDMLCRLTGANSALVVNNNAGALLLAVAALARGREAVVSRGQLVEIGGGFRVPDVVAQSGAQIVEVGTTNRTRIEDYASAVGPGTAVLLMAHRSNFSVSGFVEEITAEQLVDLAEQSGALAINDLGSGTLLDTKPFGLVHEPTVQESVAAGVAVTTFSGDKLLGGPQAGIIVGARGAIAIIRSHPLARALRVDKTTLAGLQATLLHYLRDEAATQIPVWRMISETSHAVRQRAESWSNRLQRMGVTAEPLPGRSTVGGGTLPGQTLETTVVTIPTTSASTLARKLRLGRHSVVARVEDRRVMLDPRTVLAEEEEALLDSVLQAWQSR